MVKEKYTIILDTNVLGNYKKGSLQISDFNYFQTDKGVFGSLIRFINNNSLLEDVEIAISKISVEEIKWKQNKLFEEKKRKLMGLINEFASIGESSTNIEQVDYLEHLSKKATALIGKYSIKLLDYPPDSSLKKLRDKVLSHKKPFYKKNHS